MDDQRFQALMGQVSPTNTTGQQALARQLRGQHDLGQLYSLSPTVGDFGRSMQQQALNTAQDIGERNRQGLRRARQAERDRIADQRYEAGLALEAERREEDLAREDEQARVAREQELEDAYLDNRRRVARIRLEDQMEREREEREASQEPTGQTMGATELRKYREAGTAATALEDIIKQVEATPEAFGAGKDVTAYYPDWFPNVVTESTKNIQKKNLTDKEQLTRNAVYEQAYNIINSLAGAALSQHEKTRIEAFTPAPNDDARTVRNKLYGALETARRAHQGFDMYSDYEPLPESTVQASPEPEPEPEPDPAGPASIAGRKQELQNKIDEIKRRLEQ